MPINSKEEALSKLSELPDKALIRMATLASNKKALAYFTDPLKFGMVKGFLN